MHSNNRPFDSRHGLWPWARSGFRPTGGQEGATGSTRGAPQLPSCVRWVLVGVVAAQQLISVSAAATPNSSEYVKGRIIVQLKDEGAHAVTQCAHCVLAHHGSFRDATADRSDSLDAQIQRHGVRAIRSLSVERHGLTTVQAKQQYRERLKRIDQNHPRRTARAVRQTPSPDPTNLYLVEVDERADIEAICADLQRDPHVQYAVPDYLVHAAGTFQPNDPGFSNQWALQNTGQNGGTIDADIDGPEAWGIQRGNRNVIIAVIDSGVDRLHPDLAANMWSNPNEAVGDANGDGFPGVRGVDDDGDGLIDEDSQGRQPGQAGYTNDLKDDDDENGFVDDLRGWDFLNHDNDPADDNGHGTSVAGISAAVGNNGIGMAGVAQFASIMPLKGLDANGHGSSTDLILATDYAILMGADVINASYGRTANASDVYQPEYDAIARAQAAGVVFVAAAGNNGDNTDAATTHFFPAGYDLDNIIAVAASDRNDQRAIFSTGSSNYGRQSVDLAAPGKSIYTTALGQGYWFFSGTSAAAPHVTGMVALLLAHNPSLTITEVKQAMLDSVDHLSAFSTITVSGGRLNAAAALTRVTPAPLLGDLNADRHVDAPDLQLLVSVLLGLETTPAIVFRADLDKDGDVDAPDLQHLINILLGLASATSSSVAHVLSPAATPTVAIDSGAGAPGATLTIPITLTNHGSPSIAAMSVDLSYDASRLVFHSAQVGAAAAAASKQLQSSTPVSGMFRLVIFGLNQFLIGDGTIAQVTMDVLPAAPSGSATMTFSSASASTADALPQNVPLSLQSGTIQVASSGSLAGSIRYYSNGQPVALTMVELHGFPAANMTSDATGAFTFGSLPQGDWRLEPLKNGGENEGVSSADALYILQHAVGLRTLDANQRLACDVTGNGTISALDAALILRYKVGMITKFPVAQACGSDWVFVPTPGAAPNQQLILPQTSSPICQRGAITYQPFTGGTVSGQDFTAILFGDCTGNWQPGL